ncbi:glycerophosphoryl diester phosphodiesterase family protein [Melghirimyces profundicolus]|uniref:Glycerophosphoryl diester phosphodiesterase family protein n=1 Tax=Melghirimyces profundicolus TaxID=1242148 RepID=A0A2T6BG80_9BACL|nr:glycerophosphoryl diester phosphodiesterase membrane domain-containing protein [Melghirimyces profundicolus]PTX55067.1 glycerophosphoryl diester phosphodiesterase family protein [Melghirimyces profundicolus]
MTEKPLPAGSVRPWKFTGILDGVFRILRVRLWSVWAICAAFLGVGTFFFHFSLGQAETAQPMGVAPDPYAPPETSLVLVFLSFVIYGLSFLFLHPLAVASVTEVARRHLRRGEATGIREAFRLVGRYGGSVLMTMILKWVLMIACLAVPVLIFLFSGLLLGAVTGDWASAMGGVAVLAVLCSLGLLSFLYCRLFLAVPVILEENTPYWPALKRSWQLTRSAFWRTFGLLLVLGLILYVFNLVPSLLQMLRLPLEFFLPPGTRWISNLLLSAMVAAFTSLVYAAPPILAVVLYYERRFRKEGWDLAAEAEHLRRETA